MTNPEPVNPKVVFAEMLWGRPYDSLTLVEIKTANAAFFGFMYSQGPHKLGELKQMQAREAEAAQAFKEAQRERRQVKVQEPNRKERRKRDAENFPRKWRWF